MLLIEPIIMIVCGVLFICVGLRIWKKEQINLIHGYHHKRVKQEDKKLYTEKMGKAIIIMGVGICLNGIINFVTNTSYGWIAFYICFIGGFIIIIKVQKKYNKGMF